MSEFNFKRIPANYFLLLDILISLILLPNVLAQRVKHPHELDLGDLENDEELLRNRLARDSKTDCPTYYRRLVKHLFNSNQFKLDAGSEYFIANVPLRLNKLQWDLLRDIEGLNLNEVDDLLAEVLKQSKDEDWVFPAAHIVLEHYKQQIIQSLPSLTSPPVLIACALLMIIASNRFFHLSKLTFSAMILLIFLSICVISYGMSYWECMSDLEVEQMIQLSKRKSQNNPCKDYHGEHEGVLSSLKSWALSSENKCLEHMRHTFKSSKKYCDPLDVLAKWFGKIQMSYFTSVFEGFFELISNATASSNFLFRTIAWVIGFLVFIYLLLSFGKVVIKAFFRGFFTVITTTKVNPETHSPSSQQFQRLSSKLDELLDENQHMKRELTFIRECSVERTLKPSPRKIEGSKNLMDISEEESTSK